MCFCTSWRSSAIQPLRRLRQQLGQRKRSHALDQRCPQDSENQWSQNLGVMLPYDIINQEFRGVRQDEPSQSVSHHQRKSQRQ